MFLKIELKGGKISNLTDARFFASLGAKWLSFQCNPAYDNFIESTKIKEIKAWISGPKICLECEGLTLNQVENLIELLNPTCIQSNNSDVLNSLSSEIEKIYSISFSKMDDFLDFIENTKMESTILFRLNFPVSEFTFLHPFDANPLKKWIEKNSPIFNVNGQPIQIDKFIVIYKVKNLELIGGEEEKTGLKSFETFDDLMDLLEK